MSDPDRPEHAGRAAFEELEAVVRNVTEQLAGYRRRALSAEAQVRDLEQIAARAATEADALRAARERVAELERALSAAESVVAEATATATAAMRASAQSASAASSREPANAEVLAENSMLRDRLTEASDRTRQIVERVRFMRQQLSTGADR